MEAEIISILGILYNMDKNSYYGVFTTNENETFSLAILAYREYFRIKKKITNPEMFLIFLYYFF